MTGAQHKLTRLATRLATTLTIVLATGAPAVASTASPGLPFPTEISCAGSAATNQGDGMTSLVVVADPGRATALASDVRALGGRVCDRFERILDVRIPARAADALERDASAVLPAPRPYALGEDEGVAATNAGAWHARGLTGAGAKVAVIDIGFGGLGEAQAAGDLPSSAITVDYCPGHLSEQHHGTAVAEVVAAEAPGAQLYLICIDGVTALARAASFVVAHGVRIVNHSVGWFGTAAGDGRGRPGTPDAVVAGARAHGVLWVNAAGNEAPHHWRGVFADADGDGFLDFAPGDSGNEVTVPPGAWVCAFLRWAEWPTARHDYNLYIQDAAEGQYLNGSEGDQHTNPSPPLEEACWGNPPFVLDARVVKITVQQRGGAGSAPLELFVEGAGTIEHWTAAGSIADPATSRHALAVGAFCWQTGLLEWYSSQGPTVDGRIKPDLVAPDSVSSPTYGAFFRCGASGFSGTSAAAPHVAGAAALIQQRFPFYGVSQIRSYLLRHAADLGPRGADNQYGAGRLQMPPLAGRAP